MPPKRRGGSRPFFRDRNPLSTEKPEIYKPREKYPTLQRQPRLVPLRETEVSTFTIVKNFRKQVRDGPLYTVLDVDARVHKPGEPAGIWSLEYTPARSGKDISPFDAFPTYSQKYKKPRRPLPKLQGRSYIKPFFPAELHQYIDPSSATSLTSSKLSRAKILLAVEGEDEENPNEEDDAFMEEEEDDDFEADEDDDDDYNAENYFSAGDSDGDQDDAGHDDH